MQELYKFVNENRINRATNPLFVDGIAYSNPTDDTLYSLGYKQLVVAEEMPVQEGFYAVPVYKDGEVITQTWKLEKEEEII